MRRFKTGTPAAGDAPHHRLFQDGAAAGRRGGRAVFILDGRRAAQIQPCCYLTYTNEQHARDNPRKPRPHARYTPALSRASARATAPASRTKVVRFADKPRHQLFIEPDGAAHRGDVHRRACPPRCPRRCRSQMLHSVAGLENARDDAPRLRDRIRLHRPDRALPDAGDFKKISGLYGAGQFNGTSGYEEAAAQGFVAGSQRRALKILRAASQSMLSPQRRLSSAR